MKPKRKNYDLIHTIRIKDAPEQMILLYDAPGTDRQDPRGEHGIIINRKYRSTRHFNDLLKTSLYPRSDHDGVIARG